MDRRVICPTDPSGVMGFDRTSLECRADWRCDRDSSRPSVRILNHRLIQSFGNACCSSFTPASVTRVPRRSSVDRLVSPFEMRQPGVGNPRKAEVELSQFLSFLRCRSPASVAGVPLRPIRESSPRSATCTSPASAIGVKPRCSEESFANPFRFARSASSIDPSTISSSSSELRRRLTPFPCRPRERPF